MIYRLRSSRFPGLVAAAAIAAHVIGLAAVAVGFAARTERAVSAFPAAVTLSDPYTWECAGNSAMFALAAAIVARYGGEALARSIVKLTAGLRSFAIALCCAPAAAGPLAIAYALQGQSGWVEKAVAAVAPSSSATEGFAARFLVVASACLWGVPIVTAALARELARLEPALEDSARLYGLGRGRTWREILLPPIRGAPARAFARVFALALVEPCAPVLLGVRKTLAFQIVQSAVEWNATPAAAPRCAALALIAVAIAALVTAGAERLGRARPIGPAPGADPRPAGRLGPLAYGVLFAWPAMVVALAAGLVRELWGAFDAAFAHPGLPSELSSAGTNSAVLGAVVGSAFTLAALVRSRHPSGGLRGRGISLISSIPPLCIGAGAIACADVLGLLGNWRFAPIAAWSAVLWSAAVTERHSIGPLTAALRTRRSASAYAAARLAGLGPLRSEPLARRGWAWSSAAALGFSGGFAATSAAAVLIPALVGFTPLLGPAALVAATEAPNLAAPWVAAVLVVNLLASFMGFAFGPATREPASCEAPAGRLWASSATSPEAG